MGGKQTAGSAAVAAAWPRSTGVLRGECSLAEGVREGRPESGLGHLPRPEGGTEGRPWAGWWPSASGSVHFGLLGWEALQRSVVCTRVGALARAGVCFAGALRVPRPHPGRGSFVFHGGTTPLSSTKHPLSVPCWRCSFFPIADPRESFAEQVSGVKLLDSGWGDVCFCRVSGSWSSCEPECCLVLMPETPPFLLALQAPHSKWSPLLFLHFSCSKTCLLDFLY